MKKRYCRTVLQHLMPCDNGWASYNNIEWKNCYDEPMEKNCHNIIDTDNLYCPYCKSKLEELGNGKIYNS